MSFIDALRQARGRLAASCAAVVAACGPSPAPAPRPVPPAEGGARAPLASASAPTVPSAPAASPAPPPLAGASSAPPPPPAASPAAAVPAPGPAVASRPGAVSAPSAPAPPAPTARAPAQRQAARAPVAAAPAANWEQFRLQAAHRVVQANPGRTYMSDAPDPLLAIPVLEIELEADGRVRRISVLRQPRQAKDTVQIAIDSVRRAAPFGDVSHLPRPWKYVETFLFDDERRFKPRSLDDG